LVCPDVELDGFPAIELGATLAGQEGRVYLSQIYGSFESRSRGISDEPGDLVAFSCPHCREPFPVEQICRCGAPMIGFFLVCGGILRICTRSGCEEHFLQFEDPDDAFILYESQSELSVIGREVSPAERASLSLRSTAHLT